MTKSVLRVWGLNVYRGRRPIVVDFDLDIRQGDRIFLRGQNGAGKSSLMEAILGVLPSIADKRTWLDRDGSPLDHGGFQNGGVFYLRQHSNLFPSLSLRENILIGSKIPTHRAEQELQTACRAFPELASAVKRTPSESSAGQRQLAACVQALMRRPLLMVLDEPSAGLASQLIPAIYSVFDRSISAETATIFSEQHVDHALKWSTRVIEITRDQDAQ